VNEFELINNYFKSNASLASSSASDVLLGIGDDAAIVRLGERRLVVATDTLNSAVHFPVEAKPEQIATRVVAVNLSDFAAMGAIPHWATLSLSMPNTDEQWLAAFSHTLLKSLLAYDVQLIGGDTTQGPLSISLTVMGESKKDNLLVRSGACVGDDIWLSAYTGLGKAGLDKVLSGNGLPKNKLKKLTEQEASFLVDQFYQPVPRLQLGQRLLGIANAAIDISDGLLAEAEHLATQSQCVLTLNQPSIPVHPILSTLYNQDQQWQAILCGGDDYELLFTASVDQRKALNDLSKEMCIPLARIGQVDKADNQQGDKVILLDQLGRSIEINEKSYQKGYLHFNA